MKRLVYLVCLGCCVAFVGSGCRDENRVILLLKRKLKTCESARERALRPSPVPQVRKKRPRTRTLPPPLRLERMLRNSASAVSPDSPASWPIQRIPKRPLRGKKPTSPKRLRYIRNMFWRYMRQRRKRINKGPVRRFCREQARYVRKHRYDAHAAMSQIVCSMRELFRGKMYVEAAFGGAIVLHAEQWEPHRIRAVLSRYQVLWRRAQTLGFGRLLFVSKKDLVRRHRMFDFVNKWYGQQVLLPKRKGKP